jgi:hypothetical protein
VVSSLTQARLKDREIDEQDLIDVAVRTALSPHFHCGGKNMGVTREQYGKFKNLDPNGILEAISNSTLGSTHGQEELNFLKHLLSTRVAGILTQQLQGDRPSYGSQCQ